MGVGETGWDDRIEWSEGGWGVTGRGRPASRRGERRDVGDCERRGRYEYTANQVNSINRLSLDICIISSNSCGIKWCENQWCGFTSWVYINQYSEMLWSLPHHKYFQGHRDDYLGSQEYFSYS